ncbi:MAG: hypothetical protein PVJ67_06345 [Candidatus Pacearchaeota archaeon]|jgi:hypothetical protein
MGELSNKIDFTDEEQLKRYYMANFDMMDVDCQTFKKIMLEGLAYSELSNRE